MSDLGIQLDVQARELRDAKDTIRVLARQVKDLRALLSPSRTVDAITLSVDPAASALLAMPSARGPHFDAAVEDRRLDLIGEYARGDLDDPCEIDPDPDTDPDDDREPMDGWEQFER